MLVIWSVFYQNTNPNLCTFITGYNQNMQNTKPQMSQNELNIFSSHVVHEASMKQYNLGTGELNPKEFGVFI